MINLFTFKKDIPFMRYSHVTTFISLFTFVVAIFFLFTRPLHFSVEFTGGTDMELRYSQAAPMDKIRTRLDGLKLGEVSAIQDIANAKNVTVRLPLTKTESSAQLSSRVFAELQKDDAPLTLTRVEYVGPSVGKELASSGLMALIFVCIGILIYLALRFEWRFALAAIIANMHDVVIILGFFAFFQWEFSLNVLAGVLAVLGYSVNESVVVFDRIREVFRKREYNEHTVPQVIDHAITSTMSRTIITHLSTQMMVTSMLFLGGPTLHYFALALTIGILFGIYSSVLVASPIALALGVSREHFLPKVEVEREEAVV